MRKKTPCFVNLRIVGERLVFQEITDEIGISPDNFYKKGEVCTVKVGRREETIVHKEDSWIAHIETRHNKKYEPIETIEDVIDRFMEMIRPAANYIKMLSSKAEITLWIDAYPKSEQQNIHISKDIIKNLGDMGITLDCSMMFLKSFYDGTYDKNGTN